MSGAQNHSRAVTRPLRGPLRNLVHHQPLLPLASSTACGILIDSLLVAAGGPCGSPYRGVVWICLSLGLSLLILWRRARFSGRAVVLVFLPLAACSHCLSDLSYQRADVLRFVGSAEQSAVLEGVIDRPVVLRRHPLAQWRDQRGGSPWQTHFELNLHRMRMGHEMQSCSGRVLVMVDGDCSQGRPGDALRLFVRIGAFIGPTNPGEPDRRDVYRQRHLHAWAVCDSPDQVQWLDSHPSSSQAFFSIIASVATRGRELLLKHMDESTGALAVALVLGQREFVDESTRDLLLVTGTAHLLSVSGLHLAIVVAIASWIATLARFPLPAKILWIVSICLLYTCITGARPPVVRAAILVGTLMLALWIKRPGQPINTLSLAAMILMALNPRLLFNVGVQLSFLAVTTLLTCNGGGASSASNYETTDQEERLKLLIEGTRSRGGRMFRVVAHWLSRAVWFSGCVTAISMPLIWQTFHVLSPVSIVTNVLLGPILFLALASGVATVVTGFLFEPCMILPATVCELAMKSMQRIIELAASLPGGHHWLPSPPSWWVVVFYLLIAATMGLARCRRSSLIRYGWIALWIVLAWLMATRPPKLDEHSMEAIFVDVGHGTSVVLRFANEEVWLYDCGWLGNDTFSSRGIESVLWSLGVTRLNGIFVSHADADHFNALPGVLRRFEVPSIYTPPGMFADPEPALAAVHDVVQRRSVEVIELQRGSAVVAGSHVLRVLHPPSDRVAGTDNANSLVLRIDAGFRDAGPRDAGSGDAGSGDDGPQTLLLPGDLEPPGTEFLIRQDRPRPGGVLMAPHHGSLRMDAAAVLQWSRPSLTIVSGGRRASRPEVHQMLAATGSSVHVTNQVGAIRVQMDKSGKIDVRCWTQNPW